MKTLFSNTFLDKETLKKEGKHHLVELEYYKIEREETKRSPKFGIDVIKKVYEEDGIKTENKEIEELTNDEQEIEEILHTLKRNEVTPIGLEEALKEIIYKRYFSKL